MARLKSKKARNRNKAELITTILMWVVPIAILIWLIWAQNNLVTVDNMIFKVDGLPKSFVGYKIVHISDLCNSSLDIVDNVKELEPDIIILSGGYCDKDGDANNTVKQVKKLCKIADVYYVYNSTDKDVLKETDAINITDENVIIEAKKFDVEDFIEDMYGEDILDKAKDKDKEALLYIEYITEALLDSSDATINIMGIDNYTEENGKYEALEVVNSILENNKSEYTIGVTGNLKNVEEIAKSNLDAIFTSGTFGTNLLSDKYTKGTYGVNGTQMFITGGIGKHEDVVRIFNFPQIQCITLSDGTLMDKNPLEKFIGFFVDDVGTIFDGDGGFKEYKYEYKNED